MTHPTNDSLLTGDELAEAYLRAKGNQNLMELHLRRLIDLMEADQPTQDDWDDAIADAKSTLLELHS